MVNGTTNSNAETDSGDSEGSSDSGGSSGGGGGSGGNSAPVANAASPSTESNLILTGNLSATDADGDSLTYSIVSNPSHGTLTLLDASTGAYRYISSLGHTGADSFTFKANDGTDDSADATISISVGARSAVAFKNSYGPATRTHEGKAVATDTAGNFYVVGYGGDANQDSILLKYDANGDLDTSFGSSGVFTFDAIVANRGSQFFGVTLDSAGNIYIAGSEINFLAGDAMLLKVTSAGVLDNSFGSSGVVSFNGTLDRLDTAYDVAVDDNGDIYVALTTQVTTNGCFYNFGCYSAAIAKYDSSGTIDNNFGNAGIAELYDGTTPGKGYPIKLDLSSDQGSLYIGGHIINGSLLFGAAAVWKISTSTGALDTSFGSSGVASLTNATVGFTRDFVVGENDELYLMGTYASAPYVGKLTSSGSMDTSFNSTGYYNTIPTGSTISDGYGIAVLPNGEVYGCGRATISGQARSWYIKFEEDGRLDSGFGTSGEDSDYNPLAHSSSTDYCIGMGVNSNGNIMFTGKANSSDRVDLINYFF